MTVFNDTVAFTAETSASIAALVAAKGQFIDDHGRSWKTGSDIRTAKTVGILILENAEQIVALLPEKDGGRFVSTLNALYLREGRVHLSKWAKHTMDSRLPTIHEAVIEFNQKWANSSLCPGEIIAMISL